MEALVTMGLEAIAWPEGQRPRAERSDLGERVKSIVEPYEGSLESRDSDDAPPVDLYEQILDELRFLPEYEDVLETCTDFVCSELERDPSLWKKEYGTERAVTSLKNIHAFLHVAFSV